MYFPYGSGHIYRRPQQSWKPKPKPKRKKTPTNKQVQGPKKVNWYKYWTFYLAMVICVLSIGNLCSDDLRTGGTIPIIGMITMVWMLIAAWLALWEWDQTDRRKYDDGKHYYDVF